MPRRDCVCFLEVNTWVQKEIALNTGTAYLPREKWDAWDPILIAEGLFATANIFSSLKLVYIFSVNPYLGPLQICLGRMVIDIIKFFFVYTLVLFAFACGMNQLLWYYADMERQVCFSGKNDAKLDHSACFTWRRFSNLFESSQTLFWASFGLIDLDNFELTGIQSYTRFWGLLMFGSYCVINVVVLLNLLIAMMNHSYQIISEHADVEWKFARTKLWLSYFEDGATVPPPFNIIPTPKSIVYLYRWVMRKCCGNIRTVKKEHLKTIRRKAKQASERDLRYQMIMRNLVRRYITKEQRNADNQGVTEDDVNEIKQDISAFRYELIEIMKNSGFNTSTATDTTQGGLAKGTGGKKGRQKERRLMKGFNIGLVEGSMQTIQESDVETSKKSPMSRFARLARLASGKKAKKAASKWPHRSSKNHQDSLSRSRSMDSMSSEVSSEGEATHNDTTTSGSSLSMAASVSNGPNGSGTLNEVVVVPSDDESSRCDRATNTDTPALKWSKLTKKLGVLTFPSRLRMAFHESEKEPLPPRKDEESANQRLHNGRKTKARRTVSAPAPSMNQKHPQSVKRHGKTPFTSIPSVSVTVEDQAIPTLSGSFEKSEELTSPRENESSELSSPSSPKQPRARLEEHYAVPTVHLEEEVVKGLPKKNVVRRESTTKKVDSDPKVGLNVKPSLSIPEKVTSDTVAGSITVAARDTVASNQSVSPHKPSNGTLGLISMYGIEPVNKEMRTGWI